MSRKPIQENKVDSVGKTQQELSAISVCRSPLELSRSPSKANQARFSLTKPLKNLSLKTPPSISVWTEGSCGTGVLGATLSRTGVLGAELSRTNLRRFFCAPTIHCPLLPESGSPGSLASFSRPNQDCPGVFPSAHLPPWAACVWHVFGTTGRDGSRPWACAQWRKPRPDRRLWQSDRLAVADHHA